MESVNLAAAPPLPGSNVLLAGLPSSERTRVLALCEPFEMQVGAVLCDVDEPYQHAYFPTSGLIKLVSVLHDHNPLEMALVGQEGMLGATLVLGIGTAPIRAVVHAPGMTMRIEAADLQRQLADSRMLREVLNQYLYMRLVELSLAGGCIRYHRIEQRLARALLLAEDRQREDHFYLTHGELADMLGVRRSSITIAAGGLQERKLISYTRGSIRILDRPGLEDVSCECYQVLQARQRH